MTGPRKFVPVPGKDRIVRIDPDKTHYICLRGDECVQTSNRKEALRLRDRGYEVETVIEGLV